MPDTDHVPALGADPAAETDPTLAGLLAARPQLRMHAMDGLLFEGIRLAAIADALGTPVWVYGAQTLRQRYRRLATALAPVGAGIHFAVKANDHLAILALLGQEGAGADVVSGGELQRARVAGIRPDRIVFSGVGKTTDELRLALGAADPAEAIAQINVESAEELEMLSAIAAGMGREAQVALRVNPDIDAGTHAKITTGRADNKFGIPAADAVALYAHAAGLPGIRPIGLALHIGSQILSLAPYRASYHFTAGLVADLRAAGNSVTTLDCGGGLGIGYGDEPDAAPEAFAGLLRATLGTLGLRLMVEPGRWLVAPAGLLLASIILQKQTNRRRFVVLDAAMNDLVRPAMYDAWHGVLPLSATDFVAPADAADLVGPVCETGDTFARDRVLPDFAPGARVAILDAGAYGAVMSSTYNARPLAAQVLVDGDLARWDVIRPRQDISALWAQERIPEGMPRPT